MESNPQLELAHQYVQNTGCNIFLTGKAGTGKTTFLHTLKKQSLKRMIVVAPTGVAAINAGGVTIHSFFQLSFGPYVQQQASSGPGENQRFQRFNRDKINLIRSLDLLVIDEISMVRADTLDAVDDVLRRYRNRSLPFGGVQLLMIGDLHQLSPVVKEDDWKLLKNLYPNMYFFSSRALIKAMPVNIELKHIYRQNDTIFIDLLNHIRENRINEAVLSQLNQRYVPDFNPGENDGFITLTTHNYHAKDINGQRLEELQGAPSSFKAVITGDFPEYLYPADETLVLKEGAQVMFVKNDPSREKLFYNGKIGKVISIEKEKIVVLCKGDPAEIEVQRTEWQNLKYEVNASSKEIDERVDGTFSQFPLKLAWAITIHKSQGLTFEKAIIDAGSSFAHGQVYVALSRCKSFEGMVLRTPITMNSVKTDGTVASYTRSSEEKQPGEAELERAKIDFQYSLLYDLFNFDDLKLRFFHSVKLTQDHEGSLQAGFLDELSRMKYAAEKEIYPVAEAFKKQLLQMTSNGLLPEDDPHLQDRLLKACNWFVPKINTLSDAVGTLAIESDNKEVKKNLDEAMTSLSKDLYITLSCLKSCIPGFDVSRYLQVRAHSGLNFQQPANKKIIAKTETISGSIGQPLVYVLLKKWRDELAKKENVPVYRILPQKTLAELATKLPATLTDLKKITGIGKQKAEQFGEPVIEIITSWCRDHGVPAGEIAARPNTTQLEKSIRTPLADSHTKAATFQLYNSGKTVDEIAAERGLTINTIENHLAHYVATGELDIIKLFPQEKIGPVMAFLADNLLTENPLSKLKLAMGADYSFSELRIMLNYYNYVKAEAKTNLED